MLPALFLSFRKKVKNDLVCRENKHAMRRKGRRVYVRGPCIGAGEKTILPFIMKGYREISAVNVFRGRGQRSKSVS